jgi:hypothetical protein
MSENRHDSTASDEIKIELQPPPSIASVFIHASSVLPSLRPTLLMDHHIPSLPTSSSASSAHSSHSSHQGEAGEDHDDDDEDEDDDESNEEEEAGKDA